MAKKKWIPRTPIEQDLGGSGEDEAPRGVSSGGNSGIGRKPRNDVASVEAGDNVISRVHAPRPVASLDVKRKLSKKQLQKLNKWRGEHHGRSLDAHMRGIVATSRAKFGHTAVFAANEEGLLVGIPCPLAFEYLIAQDCFLLALIYQIVGKPSTLKSALLYEIFRWFRRAGGGSHLEEVESKLSREFLRSIVGFEHNEANVVINPCHSVEEWQQKLQYDIQTQKKNLTGTKEEPGPGRTIPICFGVDSVSGKLSMETQEKVQATGYFGRSHPLEALSITGFMKMIGDMLEGWPFALVLNNHLKIGSDADGREVRRITGGAQLNFQESFELENRLRKRKIECADWTGRLISITCTKSSFGDDFREILARMLWWDEPDPETGNMVQVTRWDWHWSTVHLLTTIKGHGAAMLKERGVHVAAPKTSDVENTAWSRNLGMNEKDAVPWSTLGEMIAKDQVLTNTIRECLSIKRRSLLQGDYLKQIEGLRAEMP